MLYFKRDACVGGKNNNQRVTALVCANMDGSDKIKLLVTGISKNPNFFYRNSNTAISLCMQYKSMDATK